MVTSLTLLPFFDLDNGEFLKVTGTWVHLLPSTSTDPKDFQNIIERPDKSLENENFIESKYYTLKESGWIFNQSASKKAFFNLHREMRSLSKNL